MENRILVDVHEPNSIIEKLKELGLPVEVESLEVGDYIIGQILVERKEITDLFNSLTSGRLFDQLYRMKMSGLKCFMAVIGEPPTYDYRRKAPVSKEKYEYYLRTLENIIVFSFCSYGVSVVRIPTEARFVRFLEVLWKYSGRTPSLPPSVKKEEDPVEIKANILNCIPGVGMKTAMELASKYKLLDLFSMSQEELSNLEVSGKRLGKKGENIKWIVTI